MHKSWRKRKRLLRSLGSLMLIIVMLSTIVPLAIFAMEEGALDNEPEPAAAAPAQPEPEPEPSPPEDSGSSGEYNQASQSSDDTNNTGEDELDIIAQQDDDNQVTDDTPACGIDSCVCEDCDGNCVCVLPVAELFTGTIATTVGNARISVTGTFPVGAQVSARRVGVDIDGYEVIAAFDIKIEVDGIEWQPIEAVDVKISSPELDNIDSGSVFHMDGGKAKLVDIVAIPGDTAGFSADGFSVYAIAVATAENISAPTVTFMAGGAVHDTLLAGDDGRVSKPADPAVPEGMVSFRGWFLSGSDTPFDFTTIITEDTTLFAEFSGTYLIQFKANGTVFYSRELAPGARILPAPQNAIDEYVIIPQDSYIDYWYIEGGDGSRFDFTADAAANRDLVLVPRFSNLYYVFFISAGTQVGEPNPQPVESGRTASRPANPTRIGYEFKGITDTGVSGWELEDGTPYNFDTPVASDLFLYAAWTPAEVDYTVVYWVEKPDFPGDPGENPDNYIFYRAETKRAQAGSDADHTTGAGLTDITLTSGTDNNARTIKWAEFSHGQVKEVLGNGTTVINVYFKRIEFTYIFDLGSSVQPNAQANQTSYDANAARHNSTMNFLGETYRQGNNPSNGTAIATRQYSFRAKYEQNIENLWPSSANATFSRSSSVVTRSGSRNNYTYAWGPVTTSNFFEWQRASNITSTANFVTKRFTVTPDLVPYSGTTATMTANWGNTRNVTVNYHLERLLSETGGVQRTFNNVTPNRFYINSSAHSQPLTLGSNQNLSAKTIEGVSNVGSGGEYTTQTTQYDFYYTRNRFTVSFNTAGGSSIAPITDVMFGEPLSYSGYNAAFNTIPSKTADGIAYVFDGWYLDAEYNRPFDRNAVTMPNSNLILFAKWQTTANTVYYFDHVGDTVAVSREGVATGGYAKESPYEIGQFYGYNGEFTGWFYMSNNRLLPFSFDTPIHRDYELFARWKTDGFTVTYDLAGGTGRAPVDSNLYELGVHAKVSSETGFTKGEEVFYAWKDIRTGNIYYPSNTFIIPGNVTLEAQYAPINDLVIHTYIKNLEGAAEETRIFYVKDGSVIQLAGEIFTAAGNDKLVGWSDTAAGDKDYDLGQSGYTVNGNKTFYGVWDLVYTIKFTAETGGQLAYGARDSYEVPNGTQWTDSWIPELSIDAGYYFVGWEPAFPDEITRDWIFTAKFAPTERIELIANSAERVYNGQTQTVTGFTGLPEGLNIDVTAEGSGIAAGTYAVSFDKTAGYTITDSETGADVTDRYIVDFIPGILTITKKPLEITAASAEKVYDGTALTAGGYEITSGNIADGQTLDSVNVTGEQLNFGSSDNIANGAVIINGEGENVTSNYNITYMPGTLNVLQRPATVTANDASKLFGESDPEGYEGVRFEYFLPGDEPGADEYTVERVTPGEAAGLYEEALEVTVFTYINPNYDVTLYPGNFRITDNPVLANVLYIIADSYETTYDGTEHSITTATVAMDEGGNNTVLPAGLEVVDVRTNEPSSVNAGVLTHEVLPDSYRVYYTGPNGNREDVTDEVTVNLIPGKLTVNPAPLKVVTDSRTRTYNGTALTAGGRLEGLVNGETATVITTGEQINAGQSDNTYNPEIIWETALASNYTIADEEIGVLTVTPRTVMIVADPKIKVYGESDPEFTHRPPVGLLPGDEIAQEDIELYRNNESENVGVYYINARIDKEKYPNYNIVYIGNWLTITPRLVVLVGSEHEITVGTPEYENWTEDNLTAYWHPDYEPLEGEKGLEGDDVQWSYSVYRRNTSMEPGEYETRISMNRFQNPNYLVYVAGGKLIINPAVPGPSPEVETTPTPGTEGSEDPTPTPGTETTEPTPPPPPTDDDIAPPEDGEGGEGEEGGDGGDGVLLAAPPELDAEAPAPIIAIPAVAPPLAGGLQTIEFLDDPVPLMTLNITTPTWALWNLILSVTGVVIAIAMGIRAFGKKKKEDEMSPADPSLEEDPKERKKSLVLSFAVPVAAILACILFIFTQDMSLPMAYVDQWTAAHAALLAAGLISFIFADHKVKNEEDEQLNV